MNTTTLKGKIFTLSEEGGVYKVVKDLYTNLTYQVGDYLKEKDDNAKRIYRIFEISIIDGKVMLGIFDEQYRTFRVETKNYKPIPWMKLNVVTSTGKKFEIGLGDSVVMWGGGRHVVSSIEKLRHDGMLIDTRTNLKLYFDDIKVVVPYLCFERFKYERKD